MKKRAFDDDETERAPAPAVLRKEPTPRGRTSIALVFVSWLLPLVMIRSIFADTIDDPTTHIVHRAITLSSIALLLVAMGLAFRAIDIARKNPRVRRRLAIATILVGLSTPLVWFAESVFAYDLFVARERRDAAHDAPVGDATSSPRE